MWAAIHRDVRDISFLLDTGASVSILSKEVFDEIPKEDQPHLQQTDKKLSASNGSIIHTHGIATLTIDVQGMPIQEDFWICNCDATGILGIPFMEKANVVLDIGRRRVFIKNQKIRLHDIHGKALLSKVTCDATTHVPPGREAIIPGRVCSKRKSDAKVAQLEPATCLSRNTGALASSEKRSQL